MSVGFYNCLGVTVLYVVAQAQHYQDYKLSLRTAAEHIKFFSQVLIIIWTNLLDNLHTSAVVCSSCLMPLCS